MWIVVPGFEEFMLFDLVKVLLIENSASTARFFPISAFEFPLPPNGRFEEKISLIFEKVYYCNGWNIIACSNFQSNDLLFDEIVSHTESDAVSYTHLTLPTKRIV